MRSRILSLGLIGVLAVAFVATAAAPPTTHKPFASRAADQLDFLFHASDRPILLRIHLRAGDKPYNAVWEAYMDKLFAWVDKDNNGELNSTEAVRVVPAQQFSTYIQGGIGGGGNQTVPFITLDKDKDGKVSKEEFRDYYRRDSTSRPLNFSTNNAPAQQAKQVNEAIYRKLGREPKGKLTRSDAAKLPSLFARFDENEDEYLTATELNTQGSQGDEYAIVVAPRSGPTRVQPAETTLIQIEPTHTAAYLGQLVFNHYDKNKDGKLDAKEVGFDKAAFARLDANKDGKIGLDEIQPFFFREPDLVFKGTVGPHSVVKGFLAKTGLFGKSQRVELLNEKSLPEAMGKKVKRVNGENLSFDLGDARFAFQATEGQTQAFNRLQGIKQFYLQQFDAIADKDGSLTRGKDNDGNRFIMQLFTYADKNADAKLMRGEFSEWLDLMGEGGDSYVTLQVTDSGRNLFNVLDLNSDRRLSAREMSTAWGRIEPLCKDSQGLAQSDLPRTLQIQMAKGQVFAQPVFVFFGGQQPTQPQRKGGNAPAWFTKMDRNTDGDVSLKEWLGTEEGFRAIDTDNDGLISGDEARVFDTTKGKKDASKK